MNTLNDWDITKYDTPFDIPLSFRHCGICRKHLICDRLYYKVSKSYGDRKSSLDVCSIECANMAIFMSLE